MEIYGTLLSQIIRNNVSLQEKIDRRAENEKNEIVTIPHGLKMITAGDKMQMTDIIERDDILGKKKFTNGKHLKI